MEWLLYLGFLASFVVIVLGTARLADPAFGEHLSHLMASARKSLGGVRAARRLVPRRRHRQQPARPA